MRPRRLVLLLVLIALSTSARLPAEALVGAAPDQRFADRVAMVLMRRPGEAGFCSALVLDSRTVLTAAHCLRPVRDMAVAYRDASGAPVVIPVEATIAHPQYRPDAIRARVEFDRRRAGQDRASPRRPFRRGAAFVRRRPCGRRPDHLDRFRRDARRRLDIGRRASRRDLGGPRSGLPRASLGRRSQWAPRGRLFGRFRGADLVRRSRDRRRHRGLGAGAERPWLRRAHPGTEARAAKILDRRGEADAFDSGWSAMS